MYSILYTYLGIPHGQCDINFVSKAKDINLGQRESFDMFEAKAKGTASNYFFFLELADQCQVKHSAMDSYTGQFQMIVSS